MKAVVCRQAGRRERAQNWRSSRSQGRAGPVADRGEVRGDQSRRPDAASGILSAAAGRSEIIGLECAGEVAAVGAGVKGWRVGERAMALLPGGGYAELAAVHHGSAMHVPAALSDEEAAAFPEVFLTAFLNLFMLAEAKPGDSVLVHGGGSGVGTASILLLQGGRGALDRDRGQRRQVRAMPQARRRRRDQLQRGTVCARGQNRHQRSRRRRHPRQYRRGLPGAEPRSARARRAAGVDRSDEGRAHGNRSGCSPAPPSRIIGSTLRTRPEKEKAQIVAAFLARFGAALEAGRLRPPIYKVVPMANVAEAHRMMQASEHFGKIVLA